MCAFYIIYAQQQHWGRSLIANKVMGRAFIYLWTPVKSSCEKSNRCFYCPAMASVKSRGKLYCFSIFTGLVFNWSAVELFTIMVAIMRPCCVYIPILLQCNNAACSCICVICPAKVERWWKNLFALRGRVVIYNVFIVECIFSCCCGIMSPCNSMHLRVVLVGISKYIYRGWFPCYRAQGKVFPSIKMRWEIC